MVLQVRLAAADLLNWSFGGVEWLRRDGLSWFELLMGRLRLVYETTYRVAIFDHPSVRSGIYLMSPILIHHFILIFFEQATIVVRSLTPVLLDLCLVNPLFLANRHLLVLQVHLLLLLDNVYLFERWMIGQGPTAQTFIRWLMWGFSHIINVLEHELRLFWHTHGAIVHFLHWWYLIGWVF